VELLVVIAIIAVLIGLLLPAVQKVRESAMRARCANNLKQWGLAFQSYHDAVGQFPLGATNAYAGQNLVRVTWVPFMWPFVEQNALYSQWNFSVPFETAPNGNSQSGLLNGCPSQIALPLYYCPSDRSPPTYWEDDGWYRVRGNYVLCIGNHPLGGNYTTGLAITPAAPAAVFWWQNSNPATPAVVKITDITDGASNTMLMSEVIMSKQDNNIIPYGTEDARGDFQNDDFSQNGFCFQTTLTPNSVTPDNEVCVPTNVTGDNMMPCNNAGYGGNNLYGAARSRHTGNGVNVMFADGDVRFVPNTISLVIWQALGTHQGNEVTTTFD